MLNRTCINILADILVQTGYMGVILLVSLNEVTNRIEPVLYVTYLLINVHLTEDTSFHSLFSRRTPGGSDFLGLYGKERWVSYVEKPLMEFAHRVNGSSGTSHESLCSPVLYLFSICSPHSKEEDGWAGQEQFPSSHTLLTPAPSLLLGSRLATLAASINGSRSNSVAPLSRPLPIPEMPEPPSIIFQEDGSIDADFELNNADEMEVANSICIRDGTSETGYPNVKATGAEDEGQLDDGVLLTVAEQAEFMKLSLYEQEREMNIRRNKCLLENLGLNNGTAYPNTPSLFSEKAK